MLLIKIARWCSGSVSKWFMAISWLARMEYEKKPKRRNKMKKEMKKIWWKWKQYLMPFVWFLALCSSVVVSNMQCLWHAIYLSNSDNICWCCDTNSSKCVIVFFSLPMGLSYNRMSIYGRERASCPSKR